MLMRAPPLPFPVPALQAAPGYAAALTLLGVDVMTFDMAAGGAVVGRAQVVMRRLPVLGRVAWLPLGPQWHDGTDTNAQAEALARLARRLPTTGARLWISTARDAMGDAGFARAGHIPLLAGRAEARLDLTQGLAALRRGMGGKWRNALVRAEASVAAGAMRLQDAPLPVDPAHWLLRLEAAQRRARGYSAWPTALTLAYARANPGDARIFWAEHQGNPIAGLVILRHGAGATYHLGWTGPDGRRMAAHQVLIWQAVCWLCARGGTRLDLGQIDPDRAPGLMRFKLGTGASATRHGRTWLHQPHLTALWGRLP